MGLHCETGRKRYRTSLSMTLIFALILSWLLGCGSKAEKGGLVFAVGGVPAELDMWERVIADFSRTSGRKVELLRQPADSDQRRQGLVVALQARQRQPDVFLMDVAWITQFAGSGWLMPLERKDGSDSLPGPESFPPGARAAGLLKQELIALPVYVDGGLLYYRKDLLGKYGFPGPPETWDDLVGMARKVQQGERAADPSFYGYVWQGAQYEGLVCNFLEMAASAGGGFPEREGGIRIDTEPNAEALTTLRDMLGQEAISPPETFTGMKEEESRLYFQKGSALFERNWPYAWSLHQFADSPVRDKVGIAPLPHFPGHPPASVLGGWHIGISRYSENQAAAMELVRYVVSLPVQKRLALELGWNPGRTEVYADEEVLAKLPHLRELGVVFSHAVARPNLPYWSRLSEILQMHLNAALAGKVEPGEALRNADAEAALVSDRYRPR